MSIIQTLTYNITSDSHILLNEQCIYKEQTVQQWDVGIRKNENQGWYILIEVAKLPQTNQPISKPFHGLLELLNEPTNRLELLFDDHWRLREILNQHDILARWKDIRKEISAQMGDSDEVRQMIEEKDTTIRSLKTELFESIAHRILLISFNKNRELQFYTSSILNTGEGLDVRLSICEENRKGGYLAYEGKGTLLSLSALKKTYNRQIKSYAGDVEFAYRYDMQLDYRFDTTDSLLQEATATITEQASERYIYHHRLNFNRVEVS